MKLNKAMGGCQSDMLHIFCDICIQKFNKSKKSNTHFNKNEWKYKMTNFKRKDWLLFHQDIIVEQI